MSEPELVATRAAPPPGRDPNGCYGQDVTPAVIETVTEQVMLQPAQIDAEGKVLYPAVYKTETQQAIVQERNELWFETVCAAEMTPEFISNLQRALKVRGYYRGPISGEMSKRTRRAIRAFQSRRALIPRSSANPPPSSLGLSPLGRCRRLCLLAGRKQS